MLRYERELEMILKILTFFSLEFREVFLPFETGNYGCWSACRKEKEIERNREKKRERGGMGWPEHRPRRARMEPWLFLFFSLSISSRASPKSNDNGELN